MFLRGKINSWQFNISSPSIYLQLPIHTQTHTIFFSTGLGTSAQKDVDKFNKGMEGLAQTNSN